MKLTPELRARITFIADNAHKGQKRRGGEDYIQHPIRVADTFDRDDVCWGLAMLHDVLEDTDTTGRDLIYQGIPVEIVNELEMLTHYKNQAYCDYIKEMTYHKDCVKVKIADIVDNITDNPSEHQIIKYRRALKLLAGCENK